MTHDLVWGVKLHRRNYARKTCLQNPSATRRVLERRVDPTRLAGRFEGVTPVLVPGIDDVARFERPARGAVAAPRSWSPRRTSTRFAPSSASPSPRASVCCLKGANTGLVGASVPPADPPTVVLSTERLRSHRSSTSTARRPRSHAGTRLSELNEAAAAHGLHLPIDLGADPAIGGMIATNTGGSRVLRYGAMRRYVLAAEVVAADDDASVFGSLAALRKDSRGLDATQLAIGSGGTLGVITGAVVDLVPLPRSTQTWWLAVEDTDRVVELLAILERRRPGALSAFELVSRAAFERTLGVAGTPANPFGDAVPERRRARRVVVRRRRRRRRGRHRRRLRRRLAHGRPARRSGVGVGTAPSRQREPAARSAPCSATTCPCPGRR